jgi:hypothetical protein
LQAQALQRQGFLRRVHLPVSIAGNPDHPLAFRPPLGNNIGYRPASTAPSLSTEAIVPACPHCSRVNPPGALFCFHDGGPLGSVSAADRARFRFVAPFVFPSGRACWTFDELALACQDDWQAAIELLRSGALPNFLGGIGRDDLAAAAREAARFPDPDRALDRFLDELPSQVLRPAKMSLSPLEIDLGRLRPGHDVRRELHLVNDGTRLLHGTISSDVPWLVVGEGEGFSSKLFSCLNETTIQVQVRGRALRASLRSQVGHVTIQSSGGVAVIVVKAEVQPTTFAAGVLAGARTPRQLAEKARLSPREAARLFESGAVARWYRDNGWSYPVEGDAVAGLAAVQQFFDALGLSAPPKLELSEAAVTLDGRAGETVRHTLVLSAAEKRPVYARAASDQDWLIVTGVDLEGSNAHVHLSVPAIPDRPGETLSAKLHVTANSRQNFIVPVNLHVASAARAQPARARAHAAAAATRNSDLDWLPFDEVSKNGTDRTDETDGTEETRSADAGPVPDWLTGLSVETALPPLLPLPPLPEEPFAAILTPVRRPPERRRTSRALWLVLLPVGLLVLLVAAVIVAASRSGLETGDASEPPSVQEPPVVEQPKPKPPAEKSPQESRPISPAPPVMPATSRDKPPARKSTPTLGGPPVLAVPELLTRNVEVVFCIDTTGSMGGLLAVAKSKIWAICNQIASGKPVPHLRVGLVAYRDRGDEYVTRVYDLRNDLDAVHTDLNTFVAAGGGDLPESVNEALDEAVNKIRWSTDTRTLRIIFLVGDAPPHMDYADDVKYPETCKKAMEKGIVINSVQCGRDTDCEKYWKDIAAKTGGAYVSIPQTGGALARETRFDGELAGIGEEVLKTVLIHGDSAARARGARMLSAARALKGPAAADRAAFCAKSKEIGPYDLLDAIKAKRTKLEDVKDEELPDSMKRFRMLKERQDYLDRLAKHRADLYEKAVAVEKKRAAELAAKKGDAEGFDRKVLGVLREQAKKFDIEY